MNTNSWNVLEPETRDGGLWTRQPGVGADGFQFTTNTSTAAINEAKFAISKSVRTTFIVLAGFNIVAAAVTALGILWDCYKGAKSKGDPVFKLRAPILSVFGTAEVFPFILCVGIVTQGIIYEVAQAKGLEGLLILGCTSISQSMLPGLFIVPYIQLIFGLETTLQALRPRPFPRRPKWIVPTCVLIVFLGLMGTYVVTRIIEAPNFCYGSLFLFVQTWRLACFAILTAIASILLTGALIVFIRLRQNAAIGAMERAAASRMVYFMVLGAILNGLLAPFFYSISVDDPLAYTAIQYDLGMVALAAGNISGILFGGLYVFLRFNKSWSIGPRSRDEYGLPALEESVRIWAPSADVYNTQMERPVSFPRLFQSPAGSKRSRAAAQETNQSNWSLNEVQADTYLNESSTEDILPIGIELEGSTIAEASQASTYTPREMLSPKESYSIFPNRRGTLSVKPKDILPATTYTPTTNATVSNESETGMLVPPSKVHSPGGRHQRDSSLISSATVQIGLRVSNIADVNRSSFQPSNRASETYGRGSRGLDSPVDPALMVEPLSIVRSTTTSRFNSTIDGHGTKQYPPMPFTAEWEGNRRDEGEESQITLSPTVYNPNANKTPIASRKHNKAASGHSTFSGDILTAGDGFKVETTEWI